jgi:HEPN domain-containing protein
MSAVGLNERGPRMTLEHVWLQARGRDYVPSHFPTQEFARSAIIALACASEVLVLADALARRSSRTALFDSVSVCI